jgi:hypothetical protein
MAGEQGQRGQCSRRPPVRYRRVAVAWEMPHGRRLHPMRILMAIAVTGAVAVWLASPALAAKVVTKYGTYEGGCQSASCLYKPMKKTHKVTKTQ